MNFDEMILDAVDAAIEDHITALHEQIARQKTRIAELEEYKEKYPPEYIDDLQHKVDVLQIEVDTLRPPFEEWVREAGLGICRSENEKLKARIAKLEAALKDLRNDRIAELEVALEEIRDYPSSQPLALNVPDEDWQRMRSREISAIAWQALEESNG